MSKPSGVAPTAEPSGRRRRRPLRWALAVLAVLLAGLAADGIYCAVTVYREVETARDSLERAPDELQAGEVAKARSSFETARNATERAREAAGHPAARIASVLPWVGDDVHAVRALTDATALVATAGVRLTEAAEQAGWDGGSIPGYSPGRIDPDVIAAAAPSLTEAATLLGRAESIVRPLDPEGKLGPIGNAVRTVKDQIGRRVGQVERAALVARSLPGFLGRDGPRTYGILMMTLSDPRGSGGFPGTYGVLRLDEGRFDLEELAPTNSDLGRIRQPVESSGDVRRRYARFGGLTHFVSSTYSPDWPTSPQIWMEMWEASGREPLDGVIGADSVWMAYVLEALGPVDTPVWPEPITTDNVSEIIDSLTQLTDDHDESDLWQTGIAAALWETIMSRPLEPEVFGSVLSRAIAERHLQVYAVDPGVQSFLDEFGATGRMEVPDQPLMVSWSGFVGSRTGFFAEKTIDERIVVNPDGTADVTMTIALTNPAPTEPESLLLGFESDHFPVGTYAAAASVYLPADATKIKSKVDGGQSIVDLVEREFDRRVVLTVLLAHSGETTTAEISYRTSAPPDGYELGIVPQPELRPTPVSVVVTFPEGVRIVAVSPGATTDGQSVTYDGVPVTPITVWARTEGGAPGSN